MVAASRPDWIGQPKSDDSIFLYRVGTATGQPDPVAARRQAFVAARAAIAEEMLARAGVPELQRPAWATRLDLRNVEIAPGAVYLEESPDGTVAAWVQVSYPLADKTELLGRIEQENRAATGMAKARQSAATLMRQGGFTAARTNLQAALACGGTAPGATDERAETLLMLGEVCAAQKDFGAARQTYDELLRPGTAAVWRNRAAERLKACPKPPRAWPLRERWGGRTVAVLCARREVGAPPRPFAALAAVLHRELGEARLNPLEIATQPVVVAKLFDERELDAVGMAVRQHAVQVVVAVLLTVDPARQGKTETVMGIEMPLTDSVITFAVIDIARGRMLYEGSFRDAVAQQSEQRLSERIGGLMIEKHLVPRCPAVEDPPT